MSQSVSPATNSLPCWRERHGSARCSEGQCGGCAVLYQDWAPPSEKSAPNEETPRTDAKILVNHRTPGGNDVVHADFARQLERDLNEARVLLANQAQAVIAMNQSPSSAALSPTPHPDTARLDWLLDNCLYLPIRYRDPLPGNCRAAIDHAMNAAPQAPCEPRPTTPGPSNRIAPTADHAAGPAERDSLAQPAAPAVSPSSSTRAPTDE